MRIVARAAGLPGVAAGASTTTVFYFDQFDGTDAIVKIPVSAVLGAASSTSVNKTLGVAKMFTVRAGGRIQAAAGTTPDLTITLDAGDNATQGSNTIVASTGSIVLDNDTTIQTFFIEATLLLGQTDSKLQGEFRGWVNNTVVARTVLTESVEDLIANGVLNFKVSADWSESIALQTAQLDFLEVVI